MLNLREAFTKAFPVICRSRRSRRAQQLQQHRCISALYISGDKAMQNYATLQPYMDFEATFRQKAQLERSIAARQLQIDLPGMLAKYAEYRQASSAIKQLELQREAVVQKLRELAKSDPTTATAADCERLKEQGKLLRNNVKQLKERLYPIEDDFIHAYLDLPNSLHAHCPASAEKLLYRSRSNATQRANHMTPENVGTHLNHTALIRFIDNSRYYLMQAAAAFDVDCTHALTSYFVDVAGFTQTSNPDFVRCVLLEANATPLTQYHMVMETPHQQQQYKLNSAYLTGGAAFESYLGAVTKLCVYPSVLPLRFVSNGRLYLKDMPAAESDGGGDNLFSATQTNAVQTFVATASASEADAQLQTILNFAVDFYAALDVDFRVVYAPAPQLTSAECLRAVIEVYSPAERRYVCVGRVSNYADFVSKRILFSARQKKDYQFLHLVGGPILYTTRLIAALLEQGIPLERCKLLGGCDGDADAVASSRLGNSTAVDEFKNIFK